jgi:serine/threonine protein kinase
MMDRLGSALGESLKPGDTGTMIIPPEFISVDANPIAVGGSGQVHLGTFAGKRVAVKKMYSQMLDGSLDELRHEILILSNLRGTPHIVLLHGVSMLEYQQEQVQLIVLEYCPLSLTALLSPSSLKHDLVLNPSLFLAVAKQLANALHVLHFKGYVFLDLKPDNIMFSSFEDLGSSLRIVDLGTACMTDSEGSCLVNDNLEKFSPIYAPPEAISAKGMLNAVTRTRSSGQIHQETFDGRCFDIYSLAVTLWAIWHQEPVPELSCQVAHLGAEDWPVVDSDVTDYPVLEILHRTKLGWRPDVSRASKNFGAMPAPLAALVAESWSHDPRNRPRAGDIINLLSAPEMTASILEAHAAFVSNTPPGVQSRGQTLPFIPVDDKDVLTLPLLPNTTQAGEEAN